MLRSTSLALPLAALAILGGCGGDSEDDAAPAAKTAETTEAAEGNTFEAEDVGFTFSYPDGFAQVDEPNDGKVVASVTADPNDVKNGIKVRTTADSELAFASYSDTIRSQFEDDLGVKVVVREEKPGDISFGVMEWSKPFTYTDLGQEETTRLKSTSYFFAAGGKTWQVECLSSTEHREEIDAACEQAIESVAPVE